MATAKQEKNNARKRKVSNITHPITGLSDQIKACTLAGRKESRMQLRPQHAGSLAIPNAFFPQYTTLVPHHQLSSLADWQHKTGLHPPHPSRGECNRSANLQRSGLSLTMKSDIFFIFCVCLIRCTESGSGLAISIRLSFFLAAMFSTALRHNTIGLPLGVCAH